MKLTLQIDPLYALAFDDADALGIVAALLAFRRHWS